MRGEIANIKEMYRKLDHYCQYLSMDKWEKEDLIQDSFLKAMENYHENDITPALLKKIANNHRIDKIRKKKEIIGIEVKESGTENSSLTSMILAEYLAEKLTLKQGIVYMLVEGFQFRLKEVGELLNITETAVKSILFRARNQLKNEESTWKVNHHENRDAIRLMYYEVLKMEDPAILMDTIYKEMVLAKPVKKYPTCNAMLTAA
ncbi:sigma factor-like helix-turn-helix DNA-binding protein [Niallia sp.]|uniref:sigma factor-like helix-turn-helix DNA-binding protein n=1 Tax=Niallia sp. TaxID=2837523 RepID=UPI00289D5CD2|nr:sigma factor-like helix-turn-helix DNA-binding protein [Niallia sp.]